MFPPKRNIGNIVAQLGDIPLLPRGQTDCGKLVKLLVLETCSHQGPEI